MGFISEDRHQQTAQNRIPRILYQPANFEININLRAY